MAVVLSMKTMDEHRPTLVPVDVPWQVSPTTPYLRLRVSESDNDWVTVADGLIHFIIVGHDSFVEVVAKSWHAESDGPERFQ
jgi:hypothetical protein